MGTIKKGLTTVFDSGKKLTVNLEYYTDSYSMVEDCRSRNITDSRFDDMSTKRLRRNWEGVANYEEALKLLEHGYEDVVDVIKAETTRSYQRYSQNAKRFKTFPDVMGFQPIIPNVLQGLPLTMVNSSMTPLKIKVIDIYYDMTCSSSTEPEEIIHNGCELLKCILGLEKQGYKLNLYICNSYSDDNAADMLCVKVKDSDKPLDIKRISFPTAHSAYFRVLGFDWYSKFPIGKYRGGYGCALGYHYRGKELSDMAHNIFGKNAVYITATEIMNQQSEYIKDTLMNRLAA